MPQVSQAARRWAKPASARLAAGPPPDQSGSAPSAGPFPGSDCRRCRTGYSTDAHVRRHPPMRPAPAASLAGPLLKSPAPSPRLPAPGLAQSSLIPYTASQAPSGKVSIPPHRTSSCLCLRPPVFDGTMAWHGMVLYPIQRLVR